MQLPLSWLHDYITADLDVRELATRLAMTGTEVDRIAVHGVAGGLEHFVVGKVLTCEQHPDADRLRVCSVEVGAGEPQEIVCGAPNVAAGQTVAVARPGAIMPDGTKLKRAKLRGIVSNGMILAEDELAIGSDHAGIMVLDDALAAGTPLSAVFPLATDVLELEITPNRPDCLSVYGVAREVHAATGAPLAPAPWSRDPGTTGGAEPAGIEIVVEDADFCPRFTARVFENVTIAPSPPWLKARLMAAGQRPINNVVDITNYVMLLVGHPLHAFDLDRIAGGTLTVRRARFGERMTTLDDQERVLDEQMGLIADADGPTSIAGVMGGRRSEVEPGTTRVLMEVATWNGPSINRTANLLNLRSEASSRFEKGLSPEGTLEAQAVATQLMLELTGATLVPGTVDVGGPGPAGRVIALRDARVSGLLGAPIARSRSAEILTALGFAVAERADGLDVTVPHWRRNDVTREADLIEEVARIDGVDRLPATIQRNRTGLPGRLTHAQRLRRRAEDVLVGQGLHEVVGWSFTDPGLCDRLLAGAGRPDAPARRPRESDERGAVGHAPDDLRLAARHRRTQRRARGGRHRDLRVRQRLSPPRGHQPPARRRAPRARSLLTGAARPATWAEPEPPRADVMRAKALVEAVLGALRVDWEAVQAQRPFLHPGRAGEIRSADAVLGIFGELHPTVAQSWGFTEPVAVLAIDAGKAIARSGGGNEVMTYSDVTTFPELRQDLAVVLGGDVPAGRVREVVLAAGAPLITAAEVFDVYHGDQVGEGRVSLAMHLAFRAPDRTLTDDDVAPVRERIVAILRDELGGELRG